MSVCALKRCPWCGHEVDCIPGTPGKSMHHRLCCTDQYRPICRTTDDGTLARIMREDEEERNAR